MFVFTAKLNRKKAVIAAVALALVLGAVILLVSLRDRGSAGNGKRSPSPGVSDATGAARYLGELGWQVDPEPLEVKHLTIPRSFTGAYAEYAALQTRQGLPLSEYGGMEAVRYSFRVRNHPSGGEDIVADLVVCGQTVIAGDIQSTALDGFMTGLKGET